MLWCGFCVLLLDCSFLVVWLVGLFCRLSVVWIDSCTGRTNKVDNQNTNKTNQTKIRSLVSEEIGSGAILFFKSYP